MTRWVLDLIWRPACTRWLRLIGEISLCQTAHIEAALQSIPKCLPLSNFHQQSSSDSFTAHTAIDYSFIQIRNERTGRQKWICSWHSSYCGAFESDMETSEPCHKFFSNASCWCHLLCYSTGLRNYSNKESYLLKSVQVSTLDLKFPY